eukprot:gene12487-6235_t
MTTHVNPNINISFNNVIFKESGTYQWETIVKNSTKFAWNRLSAAYGEVSFVIYSFQDMAIYEEFVSYSKTTEMKETIVKFKSKMKELSNNNQDCLYALMRFYYVYEEKLRTKNILFLWAPETASITKKMLSASMFSMYSKKFQELSPVPIINCTINDERDLNHDDLVEKCISKGLTHPIVEDLNFGQKMQQTIAKELFDAVILFQNEKVNF